MRLFKDVHTLDELRRQYRDLIKTNHPDNGGTWTGKDFSELETEYKKLFEQLRTFDTSCTREDATKAEKMRYNTEQDEKIRDAIKKVIHLNDINIEIVGSWIWIDGNTYDCRDYLKECGYKWSKFRKKWHYTPYECSYHRKGSKLSFDEIREQYGSEKAEQERTRAIA